MKVLSVTGNSESGKTAISYIIARELAKSKRTVLIQSDYDRPTFSLLVLSDKKEESISIGKLLSVPDITPNKILENMHIVTDNFSVLSYAKDEKKSSYPEPTQNNILNFLKALALISDVVVVDTQTQLTLLDEIVLKNSDVEITAISANSKGLLYYNSLNSNEEKRIIVANQTRKTQPIFDAAKLLKTDNIIAFCPKLEGLFCQETISNIDPTKSMMSVINIVKKEVE